MLAEITGHREFPAEDPSDTTRRQSRAPAASMRTRVGRALEGHEPTLSDVASRDSKTHSPRQYRAGPYSWTPLDRRACRLKSPAMPREEPLTSAAAGCHLLRGLATASSGEAMRGADERRGRMAGRLVVAVIVVSGKPRPAAAAKESICRVGPGGSGGVDWGRANGARGGEVVSRNQQERAR